MTQTTRRQFLFLSAAAAASVRVVPALVARGGGKRVVTLVYDKALGAMRAIDRVVP